MNVSPADTLGLGGILWPAGYLSSLVLFLTPYAGIMGWIITAIFTPVTIALVWWRFRDRALGMVDYIVIGTVWATMAMVLDHLFIVQLFQASYYTADVLVYYALTFVIPIAAGSVLRYGRCRDNVA